MTYDKMNRSLTSTDLEAAWGTEQPSKVEPELNQADWYRDVWLPNARKALRGEPHDPASLCGKTEQWDDEIADGLRGHWGE